MRIICALFLLAVQAQAASWYVDNALTNSANTGTNWANAWTNFASVGFVHSAGTTTPNTVDGGDTLYISGGTTSKVYNYVSNFLIGNGHSKAEPVTVSVSADSGHDGVVIIDGQSDLHIATNAAWNGYAFGMQGNYAVLDGGAKSNLVIRNFYNPNDRLYATALQGGPFYSTVSRITFTNCGRAINFAGCELLLQKCNFQFIRGDSAITFNIPTAAYTNDSVIVDSCYIQTNAKEDYSGNGPDGIQAGSGITIKNCTIISLPIGSVFDGQHPDCMQIGGQECVKIYGNTLYGAPNAVFEGDPRSEVQHDFVLANNVFIYWNTNYSVSRVFENGLTYPLNLISNVYWLNNTFVDFPIGISEAWMQFTQPTFTNFPVVTNWVVMNNIYKTTASSWMNFGGYTNANFSTGAVVSVSNVIPNGALMTYATNAPEAAIATVTFNPGGIIVSSPTFVSYTQYSTNSDLRLAPSDTVAIGTGTNLTSLFASIGIPSTDRSGVQRSAVGNWDIGAYKFGAGGGGGTGTNTVISGPAKVKGKARFK